MKLTVDVGPFKDAVAWVVRHADAGRMSILGGVEVEAAGDRLTLRANDAEQWATVHVPATVHEEGVALPSARLLAYVAGALRAGTVAELVAGDEGLTVSAGTTNAWLPLLVAEDYPAWPDIPETSVEVPADELAHALGVILPAATDMEDHAADAVGAVLELSGEVMTVVGLDRHRIIRLDLPSAGDGVAALTVGTIRALAALADGTDGPVRLGLPTSTATLLVAQTSSRTLAGRVKDHERAVNWQPFLAPVEPTRSFTVEVAPLATLARVMMKAPKTTNDPLQVRVDVGGGGLRMGLMRTNTEIDLSDTVVPVEHGPEWDDQPWPMAVRPGYLLDCLAAFRCPRVRFDLTGPHKPWRLAGVGDDRAEAVLMPVRLPDNGGTS